jgi:hypothetical protein
MSILPELKPLGVFAILHLSQQPERARQTLDELCGGLCEPKNVVASYLRAGTIILAIMEQTSDLIAAKFSVPGGSAILTDGEYFWRWDTAEYVESYGVALPLEFEFSRSEAGWRPRQLTRDEVIDADRQITDFYRASLDEALWPDTSGQLGCC